MPRATGAGPCLQLCQRTPNPTQRPRTTGPFLSFPSALRVRLSGAGWDTAAAGALAAGSGAPRRGATLLRGASPGARGSAAAIPAPGTSWRISPNFKENFLKAALQLIGFCNVANANVHKSCQTLKNNENSLDITKVFTRSKRGLFPFVNRSFGDREVPSAAAGQQRHRRRAPAPLRSLLPTSAGSTLRQGSPGCPRAGVGTPHSRHRSQPAAGSPRERDPRPVPEPGRTPSRFPALLSANTALSRAAG